MLGKNRISDLQSLHQKKYRQINQLFIAEGRKITTELLRSNAFVQEVYATSAYFSSLGFAWPADVKQTEVSLEELKKISCLQHPDDALAICRIPEPSEININPSGLYLFLDSIRDPGNLGTLIRLADWFGLDGILVSSDCVEWTNPKVIQASMGSFIRVQPIEIEAEFFQQLPENFPVISADLEGANLYAPGNSPESGILVISNEAQGLSNYLLPYLSHKVHIPAFRPGAESLNAAMAAAIVLSECRRNSLASRKL